MNDSHSNNVLPVALAKVNALPDGARGEFAPDELQALKHFADRPSESMTEREQSFQKRVVALLRLQVAVPAQPSDEERRKNGLLRTAIDKCLHGQPGTVTPDERRVLEGTADHLNGLADPTASHLRLRGLVVAAVAALSALTEHEAQAGQSAVAEQAPAASGRGVNPDTFFSEGKRARIREFADIPIDVNARVVEHTGDLEIAGSIPDDVTLVVNDGGVTVHGQCAGNVLAKGTIKVVGSVSGAWTISTEGDIDCERVLGGAKLIARYGSIRCTATERPDRMFAGTLISVAGDARGGTMISPDIAIQGKASGVHTQVLRTLVCGEIDGGPREPAITSFRSLISPQDYDVDLDDATLTLLRDTARFRIRAAVGDSMLDCLRTELCGLQRARLCALSGRQGVDIGGLRGLQCKAAFLGVAITIGNMLEQVILDSLDLSGDAQSASLKSGTDECLSAVKFLERELGGLIDEHTRDAKALMVSACKHLSNLAKRANDASEHRSVIEEVADALLARLAEFRAQCNAATDSLHEVTHGVREMIGDVPALETDVGRLNGFVASAVQMAGGAANTGPMRALKALAERYNISIATYIQGAGDVRSERDRLDLQLAGIPGIKLSDGRYAERYARAQRFGPNVVLATSTGLAIPSHGANGPTDTGRILRLDQALPGPATFTCDGLTLRRRML